MPTDPNPRLGVPGSRRAAVFRAAVATLRADATLAAAVRTWRVWDGTPGEGKIPTVAEMPWVRLSPAASPGRPRDEQAQAATLTLRVELATKGTNADDPADLWAAFEAVLCPPDVARQRALRAALRDLGAETGVIRVGVAADEAAQPKDEATVYLYAAGSFAIDYRISGP